MDEVELTELTDIEVVRQDAVAHPASGFPVLIMKAKASGDAVPENTGCGCCPNCTHDVAKAVNSVGGINEKPDIAGAEHILQELAKLIASEAAELAAGAWDETSDIQMLLEATCLMKWFRECEIQGDTDDGAMMKAAGFVFKAHRKFSSDERKKLAGEGNALEDGSYPIPDEDALRRAAILARSGHGDVAAAKRLIARRAKELGVANPLADHDSTQKDAPEGVTPETSAADTAETVDKSVDDKIAEAIAEVKKDAEKREEALKSQLDELRKTPIPGNVALAAPPAVREVSAKGELLKEVAYFERQVALTRNDREASAYYEGVLRTKRQALEALS